jgi:hypothetical protein
MDAFVIAVMKLYLMFANVKVTVIDVVDARFMPTGRFSQ